MTCFTSPVHRVANLKVNEPRELLCVTKWWRVASYETCAQSISTVQNKNMAVNGKTEGFCDKCSVKYDLGLVKVRNTGSSPDGISIVRVILQNPHIKLYCDAF
jgi:hypothetical protein